MKNVEYIRSVIIEIVPNIHDFWYYPLDKFKRELSIIKGYNSSKAIKFRLNNDHIVHFFDDHFGDTVAIAYKGYGSKISINDFRDALIKYVKKYKL